jgi:predicted transcriptional regulator
VKRIRTLRPGESAPTSEPRRYKSADGYMRLRWLVGPQQYVECYEHRLVAGMPSESMEVHHLNGIRDDNRPENLAVLTPEEHQAQHAPSWVEDAVALYEAGWSTTDIAKMLRLDPSVVYRSLALRGVRFRTQADYKRAGLDQEEIERLALDEGLTGQEIAVLLGVGRGAVRGILRDRGVQTLGRRRPSGDDAELRRARKAVRERSGGLCEVRLAVICTGRGQHVHHRLMRSQGGTHDLDNLLDTCLPCHSHVHANPGWAQSHGFLLHRGGAA